MTIRLQCGHTRPDHYAQQGEAYCNRCFAVFRVIGHIGEYWVRCTRCRYTHNYGTNRESAYRAGVAHLQKTGHMIRVGPSLLRQLEQLTLFD